MLILIIGIVLAIAIFVYIRRLSERLEKKELEEKKARKEAELLRKQQEEEENKNKEEEVPTPRKFGGEEV